MPVWLKKGRYIAWPEDQAAGPPLSQAVHSEQLVCVFSETQRV